MISYVTFHTHAQQYKCNKALTCVTSEILYIPSPHSQAKPDSRYKEEYDLIQRNGFINMEFHNNNLSSPQK